MSNTTPDGTMPKPIVAYEDNNTIQSSFVEALKTILYLSNRQRKVYKMYFGAQLAHLLKSE
jgi:hypothetical protein